MRFVCQNCESKYTIADEKVRGKVLKIRCKNCGNVIEVRDPGLRRLSLDPARSESPSQQPSKLEDKFAQSFRAKPPGGGSQIGTPGLFQAVKRSAKVMEKRSTDLVHWFVAINDVPVGPVSARKVHGHRQAGRVKDTSLVWKEGLPDWVPLRHCKELIGLLATIDIEDVAGGQQTSSPSPHLGLFAERDAPKTSPLKGFGVGLISEKAASEAQPAATKPPPAPKAAFAPLTPILAPVPEAPPAAKSDPAAQDTVDADIADARPDDLATIRPLSPVLPLGQNRLVVFAAVGFFIAAITVLFFVVAGGTEAAEPQIVEKLVEKVVYRDRLIQAAATSSNEGEGSHADREATDVSARGGGTRRTQRVVQGEKKGTADDEKTRELMERMGVSAPSSAGGPTSSFKSKTGEASGASGTGELSAQQVKGVVDRNKSQLKACYEQALKQGTAPEDRSLRVVFKLKVGSSGMVKSTDVSGEGADVVPLRNCLTQSVKRWVFPTTSGESPVEFPFVFTPR